MSSAGLAEEPRRGHRLRCFLVVLLLPLIACNQSVTKQSNLDKKVRCATIGRAFIKDLERKTDGTPTIVDPTYAYNSAADTCLCRYGLYFGAPSKGNAYIIIDTLTNATIATYDTSVENNDREKRRYEAAVAAMTEDRKLPSPDPAFR